MERNYYEVYEELKAKGGYSESFMECYKECYNLKRLEGKVFKGNWSGHCIEPENDDKKYYTEIGIKGWTSGIFAVWRGEVIELEALNEKIFKDKYREFVRDLYRYIESKMKSTEILMNLPETSQEMKTQLKDVEAAYETLLNLMSKY